MLLILAIVAAGIAVNRQRAAELQKRVAIAHGLAAQADEARDRDPRIALLLGIAAQHIHADAETQASLVNTITATRYAGTLGDHSDAVDAVGVRTGRPHPGQQRQRRHGDPVGGVGSGPAPPPRPATDR
jgi:hypothetical protein